jgi:pyridoxal phosphate enzyme (YggS family)
MSLQERVINIESRIADATKKAGRSKNSVTLVAVSKRQPLEIVNEYCSFQNSRGGKVVLGENYVQEFASKQALLSGARKVHMIGPLQRNKVKLAVSLFDLIETVNSERLLADIDKEAAKTNKIQAVFLQVNVSKDKAKAGFMPDLINADLLSSLAKYRSIKIEGLMTITQFYDEAEEARKDYRLLKELGDFFKSSLSLPQCCLSMGMSDDFEVAIEEGATHVRIGSALFGERKQRAFFVPEESVLD